MQRVFFLVFAGLCGCIADNRVNLSDLKFPDPQRLNSRLNLIDTTFFYYRQEDGSETMFYQTFDSGGRIICDSTQPYTLVRFYYDSIGFVTKKVTTNGHFTWTDSIEYNFDMDSLILEQRWTGSHERYLFYFDGSGKLLRSIMLDSLDIPRQKTRYMYEGDLLSKRIVQLGDKSKIRIESSFFYSTDGMLDSSALQTNYGHTQSWGYDSGGLLIDERSNGSKRIQRVVHKMRQ